METKDNNGKIIGPNTKFTPELTDYFKDMFSFTPPLKENEKPAPPKEMVSTKVPFKFIWGRVDNSCENYYRMDIKCAKEREHMGKIM